jgi:hypothetical protein
MSLVVLALLAATVIGWLRGGSVDRLGSVPLRSPRLVLLAFGVQLAGTLVGGPLYPVGLAASAGLVVAFLVRNRTIRGTGLVALGLLANAFVVGANGAMPVSTHAAGLAGVSTQSIVRGADPRHEMAGDGTHLPWLADIVPVAFPLRPEVVSPGDVLVTAGAAQLVVVGMTRRSAPARSSGTARRVLPPVGRARLRPVRNWTSK